MEMMTKGKDKIFTYDISSEEIENFLRQIEELGIGEPRYYYGNLIDNYIIFINKACKVGDIELDRKYLIIREKYLNVWSSCHEWLLTDDDDKAEEFFNTFIDQEYW